MAMRPIRGGGVGQNRPNRQPRAAVRPVYEDFRPISERHPDQEAEKLLIYLPGFAKENIRVSTEGKNTVRVRGERLVAGNKWNRFQEDFQAPEDCNMRGIHAKFENGILIITMPWKIPKQISDEPTPVIPPPPQKSDDFPPIATYKPTVETPRKSTPLKPSAQLPKPQDTRVNEKPGVDKKILEGDAVESSKADKGTNESIGFPPIKATPLGKTSGDKEQPRDEKKISEGRLDGAVESSKAQKGTNEYLGLPPLNTTPLGEKPRDDKKILEGLAGKIEPKMQQGKEDDKMDQNSTQWVKSGKEVEGNNDTEKSNELRELVDYKGSKEKESTSHVAAGTSYPGAEFSFGNLKKSLTELNEERQLLVNSGAALLVIMALGAYVYHSIGSGRAD